MFEVSSTKASKLQPIETRLVMLQSGIKARMAVRILGKNLEDIERVALDIEKILGEVPGVKEKTPSADRIVGKPYLEIDIDRLAIARHGISVRDVQDVIETAIGGRAATTAVEGRERYAIRIRYQRELRDSIESLLHILVASSDGAQIPLGQLATVRYVRGPQAIKSENTMLVGYVTFAKDDDVAEIDVVEACRKELRKRIDDGRLILPPGTQQPTFIGAFEAERRAAKTLLQAGIVAVLLIFIIIYLQFRSVPTTLLIMCGVFIACSGGFIMLYLYSTTWFGDFAVFGVNMRDLFRIHTINWSVAVGVGFIALLGIATDDGVIVASYLKQSLEKRRPETVGEVREATVNAGLRRIRPCLMTTATTILALMPVLTSSGRGADVMVPMAIPSFGGMLIELMTLFFVPVTYCMIEELKLKSRGRADERST